MMDLGEPESASQTICLLLDVVTNQTWRVRHIKVETDQNTHQNSEGETDQEGEVDAETALYIKELREDWPNVNVICQQNTMRSETQP